MTDVRELGIDYDEPEPTDHHGRTSDDFDSDCGLLGFHTTGVDAHALLDDAVSRYLNRRSWQAEDTW